MSLRYLSRFPGALLRPRFEGWGEGGWPGESLGSDPLLRVEKPPFNGGKNFFRRGYIDLRMHEEGVRVD